MNLSEILSEPWFECSGDSFEVSRLRRALATLLSMVYESRYKDRRKDHGESSLAGSVARILPCRDVCVKRMVCTLLIRWPVVGPLVYNTLMKDCADSNPLIRSIALRTVLHGTFSALGEPSSIQDLVVIGLDDSSAHVRRAAVLGCIRVNAPDAFADRLYAMLRDSDPLVIVNCLSALDELLVAEGGVVINRHIVRHLTSRMEQMSDFDVIRMLNVFRRRYVPECEEDKFELMDSLDVLLNRSNGAIVFETIGLFLSLAGADDRRMRHQVFRRVASRVAEFLFEGQSNPEMRYLWLRFVRDNVDSFEGIWIPSVVVGGGSGCLHCDYADPICIKILKIEIATHLVAAIPDHRSDEAAVSMLLDDLFAHCTDPSDAVSTCAVKALGHLRTAMVFSAPHLASRCTDAMLKLLALRHRNATTVAVLTTLCCRSDTTVIMDRDSIDRCAVRLRTLFEDWRRSGRIGGDIETAVALVRFIGTNTRLLDDGPYLLEELMNDTWVTTFKSEDLAEALLASGLRMLFARPAEMQTVFGRYAERCIAAGSTRLAERVRLYYGLLRCDPDLTKRILDSDAD